MKLSLHWNKLITVTLVVVFVLIYSCHHQFSPSGHPEIIKITGIDADGNPDLRDAGGDSAKTFKAKAGTTINWRLNTNDISSIDRIYKKNTSGNIFVAEPSRLGSSQNWTATIDPNAKSEDYEDYSIDWTDKGGKHTYDPKIQVK